MFDFGSGELLVIGVVALVVIGPKELPGVLRTVGKTVARLRRMAGEFQGQFQDALREAELHDAMKSVSDIQSSVSNVTSFNDPLAGLPVPTFPEPAISPPAELIAPAGPVTSADVAQTDKPKSVKAKKKKSADELQNDNPQAALFDTLDEMTKKAEVKPAKKAAAKAAPKAKAKAKTIAKVKSADADGAPKKPRARKAATKKDEASS